MKTSAIVRKTFAVGDMIRDAGLTTPDDIQRFDNIVYGEDKVWQSLDVYRPKAINIEENLRLLSVCMAADGSMETRRLTSFIA